MYNNIKPLSIAFIVFQQTLITCILEFIQLWHPQFLESIRSYFIGATLLGTSFIWWDFPYYFLGCGIGWLLMIFLQKSGKIRR